MPLVTPVMEVDGPRQPLRALMIQADRVTLGISIREDATSPLPVDRFVLCRADGATWVPAMTVPGAGQHTFQEMLKTGQPVRYRLQAEDAGGTILAVSGELVL